MSFSAKLMSRALVVVMVLPASYAACSVLLEPAPVQLPIVKHTVPVAFGSVIVCGPLAAAVVNTIWLLLLALLNTSLPSIVVLCPNMAWPLVVSTVRTRVPPWVNTFSAVVELAEFWKVTWPVLPTPNSTLPNPPPLLARTLKRLAAILMSASCISTPSSVLLTLIRGAPAAEKL